MVDSLSPLGPAKGPAAPGVPAKPEAAEGDRAFKDILKDSIKSVNKLQQEADQVLEQYTRGEATDDQVVIAFRKAQIAFEALLQIRNKLVQAFEKIQQMRI